MTDHVHTLSGRSPDVVSAVGTPAPPLVLSDYLFLGALMLALLMVVDPLNLGLEHLPKTKHLPLMILIVSWVLASIGGWLRPPHWSLGNRPRSLLRVTWPYAVLAVWITAGGLYTRVVDGIQDTFAVTGVYMLAGLATAHVVRLSEARRSIAIWFSRGIALAAAAMILRMVAEHVSSGGRYHELEFLVIPVAVYFAMRPSGHPVLQRLLVVFFLASGFVFLKNTGFIVMSIVLVYLFLVDWRFLLRDSRRLYRYVVLGAIAVAVALTTLAGAGKLLSEDIALPSGNPGYRLRTYDRAISHFEDSPVWGSLFVARSTARFTAFDIDVAGGNLPTHSDVLDLAANGGVIALGLLGWGYFRIARLGLHAGLCSRVKTDTHATLHMLACMSVSGIAVYAFNPILLQPDRALLLWSALGVLLGLCLNGGEDSRATLEPSQQNDRGA